MSYLENYKRWVENDSLDTEMKRDLATIEGKDDEIKYRFSKRLDFGTAGLRGTMKAGLNAMNIYTVAQATQGFADLIIKVCGRERPVVVACDSRNNSELFAKTTACVFAANGLKTYIFNELRPTPVLSFAVRELSCIAGVNITASHNPKEYNGYKAYWEDGAQLPPDHAATVAEFIDKIDIFDGAKLVDFDSAVEKGDIIVLGHDFDEKYMEKVLAEAVYPEAVKAVSDDFGVVYTPLCGTGYRLVPEVLSRAGFKKIYTVDRQMKPDGNFKDIRFPNPEFPEVFEEGVLLAEEKGCDLIIATDPDADRVGIMIKGADGKFSTISGNQVGALLIEYIATAYEETGTMPENPYVVKTIVTTELAAKICEAHNIRIFNVLTGFKFIGEVIKKLEVTGHDNYLLGFEESYGYLKGTYARDKDAVVATMLIAEMAAYYRGRGMTLADALESLYKRYGYYMEASKSIVMDGLDGVERMRDLMNSLRNDPPVNICGHDVVEFRDYLSDTVRKKGSDGVESTNLPSSDVLYFILDNGDRLVIRPSGTEPKVKVYMLACSESAQETQEKLAKYKEYTKSWSK
ncbi:MAG: phospho-sugar mutase [Ruminococcaceae bacterium]|nr:phospho-sugar mutase [Oscillospiraceae bacterium]